MRLSDPGGRRRLALLLQHAVARETRTWTGYVPKRPTSQDADVSPAQRDEAVRWLMEVHSVLHLYPETLVLAVSILDRFLALVKARPKYLRCIAMTCFFLAAKACEEDQRVPPLQQLLSSCLCGCSPSDILRMERIVLDKLGWDLLTATALDFLHIFHAMVPSCQSGFLDVLGLNRSQHLSHLTQRLYHCLADHPLIQLRGSLLALALISLELETCCPDWLALTIDLLSKAQMDSSELIRGRELVTRSLSPPRASLPPNTVYIFRPPQPLCDPPRPPPSPLRRPAPPLCQTLGTTSTAESSRDHALAEVTAGGGEHAPPSSAVMSSPTHVGHLNQLRKITLRCKASAKRKVEQMDVDDFYDGIKRLYNEDVITPPAVQKGASSSPCPPLQPVTSS